MRASRWIRSSWRPPSRGPTDPSSRPCATPSEPTPITCSSSAAGRPPTSTGTRGPHGPRGAPGRDGGPRRRLVGGPGGRSRPGHRPGTAPRRRLRDPRARQHPARAGAAPRDGSSEPDLHRPHHARRGTAVHRRLGLRSRWTAASSSSLPRPDGRSTASISRWPTTWSWLARNGGGSPDAPSRASIVPHGSSTTSGSPCCSRRRAWSCRACGGRPPIGRRPKGRATGGRTWTGCGAGRMSSPAAGSPGTASSSAGASRSCRRPC